MTPIPFALAAVKGQARWRGSLWSPLTAASLRQKSPYAGVGLPVLVGLQHQIPIQTGLDI